MLQVTFADGSKLQFETHADKRTVKVLLALAVLAKGKIVKACHRT